MADDYGVDPGMGPGTLHQGVHDPRQQEAKHAAASPSTLVPAPEEKD